MKPINPSNTLKRGKPLAHLSNVYKLEMKRLEMKRYAPWPFSPFEGGKGDDLNFYPIKEVSGNMFKQLRF